MTNYVNKTLKKEQKELLRKVKRTALGSNNNIRYNLKLKQVGDDIEINEQITPNVTDAMGGGVEGTVLEPQKEKVKNRINEFQD